MLQQKVLWKILEKVFNTKKFIQCKTSRTLKIDVFEILDKIKNIGELFSKYVLLFLDQASSSSDSFKILILQFHIPGASLPPSPSLSNLTQSSSRSSLVSLFCPTPFDHTPTQVLDIPNHMPNQASQICYQAIYRS